MEERFLMNPGQSLASPLAQFPVTVRRLLATGAALIALLLGGCAVTATGPSSSTGASVKTDPSAKTAASDAARSVHRPSAPFIVQGPLSAIGSEDTTRAPVASLAAPAHLWERIRRGFAMPDLDNDLVRDREQWYATRPDYIQRMTERSSRYLFHIVEEIERRNMPMELALLPFIESAFNPQAVSSARAAGMWQFMPATGESFDLKQNVFRDDRRDVLASTRAALDYLQQLHDRFGDWHLALAAYNWGQGNVNRAITRNQREGLPTGYTDLTMPMETRMYVPKLQAVKNIIARPETFNTRLPEIGNHPFFDTVVIERDMDVALIARLAAISEADFRALNPSLKHPIVMAAGTPNILLPWDSATVFLRNLQAHGGPLASWTAWVVPSTMTSAEAARRVGMGESELRSLNRIPSGMKVRAGSSLLVPRSEQFNRDVDGLVADNGHLSLQPEVILRRVTVKAGKGENLARLAERYGVSPVSAAGWNKLAVNARLKPGQRITLMLPKSAAVASSSKRAVKPQARATASTKARPVAKKSASKTGGKKPTTTQKPRAIAAKKEPARVASQKP
jgi:membrane-bound lytic murein transglycosylase D